MSIRLLVLASLLVLGPRAGLGAPFDESVIGPLAEGISGAAAKRDVEAFSRHHRMRGSRGFRAAANHVVEELRRAGLSRVEIIELPADGRIFYGTQRSRPPWDADRAELWEVRSSRNAPAQVLIASWAAMPLSLAQDSESASVRADLVDVGEGTAAADYAGKDVRGKIVLAGAQPGEVAAIAVEKLGAVGVVSYAQNQRTAWWKKDPTMVRWGHLDTFARVPSFAFMVSLERAGALRRRLAAGEKVRLRASVKAGKHRGGYQIATAVIPGADRALAGQEIVLSCHLDHPNPGANDNASGCAAILEIARTMARLVASRRIAPPARTVRFVWGPEVEGTLALLVARPQIASRIRAAIHLDMVGGGPETKAVFHVTRGPASLPSFVHDLAASVARFVNDQTYSFAASGVARWPLVEPTGGAEALQAEMTPFTSGSDHEIYGEGSFRIPTIYLNDWPDRTIHTDRDTPANIDATKLKRAAFIAAASAYLLAQLRDGDAAWLWQVVQRESLRRTAAMMESRSHLSGAEAANLTRFHLAHERAVVASMARFLAPPAGIKREASTFFGRLQLLIGGATVRPTAGASTGDAAVVFHRNPALKGPMRVFGYDYFEAHFRGKAPALLAVHEPVVRGEEPEYAYEALNLVDGRRTVREIRDDLSAICGPIAIEVVAEYLRALESINVVQRPARR